MQSKDHGFWSSAAALWPCPFFKWCGLRAAPVWLNDATLGLHPWDWTMVKARWCWNVDLFHQSSHTLVMVTLRSCWPCTFMSNPSLLDTLTLTTTIKAAMMTNHHASINSINLHCLVLLITSLSNPQGGGNEAVTLRGTIVSSFWNFLITDFTLSS